MIAGGLVIGRAGELIDVLLLRVEALHQLVDPLLLRVDPLYDELAADEMTWLLETGKDGGVVLQISVEKAHPQTRFGKTLCKEGGAFECWLTEK